MAALIAHLEHDGALLSSAPFLFHILHFLEATIIQIEHLILLSCGKTVYVAVMSKYGVRQHYAM